MIRSLDEANRSLGSQSRSSGAPTLTIQVATGTGQGPTKLSAFDAALRAAGVHNFNLLCLSSVVPPASRVQVLSGPVSPAGEWGDRLYVVMAHERVEGPGAEAWAGIGWVQEAHTGRGLFVEHEGTDGHVVSAEIDASLRALCAGRPEQRFGPVRKVVRGAVSDDGTPTCALVVAVFKAEPWHDPIEMAQIELG